MKVVGLVSSRARILVDQRFVLAAQGEVSVRVSERLKVLIVLTRRRPFVLLKLDSCALPDYGSPTSLLRELTVRIVRAGAGISILHRFVFAAERHLLLGEAKRLQIRIILT